MTTAAINFHGFTQDTQTIGTSDNSADHMVSRIQFSVTVDGRLYSDLEVDIKQPYGVDYATEPLEVGAPRGNHHPATWNHEEFSDLAEEYYREAIGSAGSMIRVSPGAQVQMKNNTFTISKEAQMEIPESGGDAW